MSNFDVLAILRTRHPKVVDVDTPVMLSERSAALPPKQEVVQTPNGKTYIVEGVLDPNAGYVLSSITESTQQLNG